MNPSSITRWGGRAGRYAQFRGAAIRCLDPFDGNQPVQFAKALEYEAWLRWRFHPQTLRITRTPMAVVAWNGQKTVSSTPTFVVTSRDLQTTYHLVAKSAPAPGLGVLRAVARCTGAQIRVTLREELRSDVALFWRLEVLRSAAQIHGGEGQQLDASILDALRSGCATRAALQARIPSANPQLLDARLATLHCAGALRVDFATDNFALSVRQEKSA